MNKRLFLLAGYDKDGIIDDSLMHYIKSLAKIGDVILCMDCNCGKSELKKVSKYCIHTIAIRHCEYDFGSYKRAYIYAKEYKLLDNYDIIYLLNDSVYGPLFDIEPTLKKLESFNTDVFGLVQSKHKVYEPVESWFIGIRKNIIKTQWFDKFIMSVTKQISKENVTILYENGFTDLLNNNKVSYKCLFVINGRSTYNKPLKLFKAGNPFIKKVSFTRHYGALGYQIYCILDHINPDIKNAILSNTYRIYGKDNINKILTKKPFEILKRNIKYALYKLKVGGI